MNFEMAEVGRNVSARIRLRAGSEEKAGYLRSAIRGFLALLYLQTQNPELARLAGALDLTREGREVLGKLSMPSSEAVRILRAYLSPAP
jgi:hypothetical protein